MSDTSALRILLVEDEAMIAMMATDMLDAIGHEVAEVVSSVAAAVEAVDRVAFDLAFVDLNLNQESGLPVADRLRAAGKPYLLTTGYGSSGIVAPHDNAVCLAKPYTLAELEAALASVTA